MINREGIIVDTTKVEAMLIWESPNSVGEIRRFICLAEYHIFIEGFSKNALPMTQLIKKGQAFEWTRECKESFKKLKERLTTSHIHILPIRLDNLMCIVMLHTKDLVLCLCKKERLLTTNVFALKIWRHFLYENLIYNIEQS